MRITREHIRFLARVLEDHPAGRINEGRDLLQVFNQELEQDGGPRGPVQDHTGELIELIAGVLMEADSRNVIGGDTLEALRRAVLLPREYATAKRLINEKARFCSTCGHQFADMEIASFYRGAMMCVDCLIPTTVGCRQCKRQLALPNALQRIIPKLRKECPHCKEGVKPKLSYAEALAGTGAAIIDEAAAPPGPEVQRRRIFTNVGGGARAGRNAMRDEQVRWRAEVDRQVRPPQPIRATQPTPTGAAPGLNAPGFIERLLRDDGRGELPTTFGQVNVAATPPTQAAPTVDPRLPGHYQVANWQTVPAGTVQQQADAFHRQIRDDQIREQQRIQDDLRAMNQYIGEFDNPFDTDEQDEDDNEDVDGGN